LPILEAQATGRPVITSNCSSMPEAAGEAALLVDPESVKSIRQAACAMVDDPSLRESLIGRGFRNVESFNAKTIAARYAAIYESLFEQSTL
jgi:glycosyltransferase involved in cell wall biosynthesis